MKIHEYQGQGLLARVRRGGAQGEVADPKTPAGRRARRSRSGWVARGRQGAGARGGRGKAGGIKSPTTPRPPNRRAARILAMMLKTPQTPPEGIKVRTVLVEEGLRDRSRALL